MSRVLYDALRRDAASLARDSISSLGGDRSPEAIHQHRIATKKIRSLWIAARPVVGPEQSAASCDHLRDTARLFAPARSAYVRARVVEGLTKWAGKRQRRSIARVRSSFESVSAPLEPSDDSIAAFGRRMEEALQAIDEMPAPAEEDPDRLILLEGIGRTYGKTRRFARHAATLATQKGYHRLRRWVKFLRYQLEWLESLGVVGPEGMRADIEKLGHRLGQLHDVQEMRTFFAERSTKFAKPKDFVRTDRVLRRREARLLGQAGRLSKRALKRRPRKFSKQLLKTYRSVSVPAQVDTDGTAQSEQKTGVNGGTRSPKSSKRRAPVGAVE